MKVRPPQLAASFIQGHVTATASGPGTGNPLQGVETADPKHR
jgi:hypothetical protein